VLSETAVLEKKLEELYDFGSKYFDMPEVEPKNVVTPLFEHQKKVMRQPFTLARSLTHLHATLRSVLRSVLRSALRLFCRTRIYATHLTHTCTCMRTLVCASRIHTTYPRASRLSRLTLLHVLIGSSRVTVQGVWWILSMEKDRTAADELKAQPWEKQGAGDVGIFKVITQGGNKYWSNVITSALLPFSSPPTVGAPLRALLRDSSQTHRPTVALWLRLLMNLKTRDAQLVCFSFVCAHIFFLGP
jgi:hypothetical protein